MIKLCMLNACAGVDFKVKTLVLQGKRTKLSIWVSIYVDSNRLILHALKTPHLQTQCVSLS